MFNSNLRFSFPLNLSWCFYGQWSASYFSYHFWIWSSLKLMKIYVYLVTSIYYKVTVGQGIYLVIVEHFIYLVTSIYFISQSHSWTRYSGTLSLLIIIFTLSLLFILFPKVTVWQGIYPVVVGHNICFVISGYMSPFTYTVIVGQLDIVLYLVISGFVLTLYFILSFLDLF